MEGNSNPWRSVGKTIIHDPLSNLEDPKSNLFKNTLKEELDLWSKTLKPYKAKIDEWSDEIRTFMEQTCPNNIVNESYKWSNTTIKIHYSYGHRLTVRFKDHSYQNLTTFGTDPESDLYYIIEDTGNGSEILQISIFNKSHKTPLWTQKPVGPNAVFREGQLIFQTVENQLRYPGLVGVDKETGLNPIILFNEPDPKFQVDLIKPPYQPYIFIKTQNALQQKLGVLKKDKIHWLAKRSSSLFPITDEIYGTNSDIVIMAEHYPVKSGEYVDDAIIHDNKILYATIHDASMSLYIFDLKTKAHSYLFNRTYPCVIKIRKFCEIPTVEIGYPYRSSEIYEIKENILVRIFKFPEPLKLEFHHGFAKTKNSTEIPYTLVSLKNPKNLFVEGYGSYGTNGSRSYPSLRLAYLKRGYAFAVAFPRGGREDGDKWYNQGRTALRKQNTFDDTAAVIHTIQDTFSFKPENTIFYGRSAGGLLAANIAQQYPDLAKKIYIEVGYLDVLRTTTNPALPLTKMEYDEFGDPSSRPEELEAIKKFSPVNTVPNNKKGIYPLVVVKTALNDSQVFAYETLKWAKKLREKSWTVYVGIDTEGGHFVRQKDLYRTLAEDAVLLTTKVPSKKYTRKSKI